MAIPGLIMGERKFGQTLALRAGLAVLLFLPIGIAWSIMDDPTPQANPILLSVTVAAVLAFAALYIVIGKTILIITEQGVRRESISGVQEILWSQVKETRYVDRPMRLGVHFGLIGLIVSAATKASSRSNITLTVIGQEGTRLKLTSNFQQAKDAANIILARILPDMIAAARSRLRRGETLRFGTVAMTQADLAWKSQPGVPFTDLASAEITGGMLKVKRSGKWRSVISVPSDRVPDVFVLLELLDEMAPQLRQKLDPLARVRN